MLMNFPTVPLTELESKGIPPHPGATRPIILVVDDEAVIVETLAVILNQHGFTAMVAYNGEAALAMAELVAPDLLLSDVMMPGMSGIELALTIRQLAPACKILLFSGQAATVDLLGEASEEGKGFSILSKPIHPKDLLARVSDALEVSHLISSATLTGQNRPFEFSSYASVREE